MRCTRFSRVSFLDSSLLTEHTHITGLCSVVLRWQKDPFRFRSIEILLCLFASESRSIRLETFRSKIYFQRTLCVRWLNVTERRNNVHVRILRIIVETTRSHTHIHIYVQRRPTRLDTTRHVCTAKEVIHGMCGRSR